MCFRQLSPSWHCQLLEIVSALWTSCTLVRLDGGVSIFRDFPSFESNQGCFCAWNHMKAFSAWKLYQHCMSDMRSRWMKSLIRETETWRNCTGNSTPTFLTRFQEGPWRKRNSDEFVIEDDFWVWLIFVRENLMLMCIICDRCGMWDSHGDVI